MGLRSRLKSMRKAPEEVAQKAVFKRENYERLSRKELKQYAKTVGVNTVDYKGFTTKSKMLTDINKAWEKARLEAEKGNPAVQDKLLASIEKAKKGELYAEETASSKEKKKKLSALLGGGGGSSGDDGFPPELIRYLVYFFIALVFLSLLLSIF